MKRIFILTEAGEQIGLGHLTRCLALHDAMKRKKLDSALLLRADRKFERHNKLLFYRPFDWLKNISKTLALIRNASAVVIDSYRAPLHFFQRISDAVRTPVFFDDYTRLTYPPGIILNGAIDAENIPYPKSARGRHLLGSTYALLRNEFRAPTKRSFRKRITDVLLTFGGSDRSFLLNKLLAYLQNHFPDIHYHVVTSSDHILPIKGLRLYQNVTARQMRQLMLSCDIAVSGGGQTLAELASCGLPTIAICFAANQRENIAGWKRTGFLKFAGDFSSCNLLSRVASELRRSQDIRSRKHMSRIGRKAVDGHGSDRVVSAILESIRQNIGSKGRAI